MAFGTSIRFATLGLLLTGCLEVAPGAPKYKSDYSSTTPTAEVPATPSDAIPQQPAPAPAPQQTTNLLPTNEEIQKNPVGSGLKLYEYYCAACHLPYDNSNKRGRSGTAGRVRDPYVMKFPPHEGKPWPVDDIQAYGLDCILKVPIGTDPFKAHEKEVVTTEEKPTEAELPSLDQDDSKDPPSLGSLGNLVNGAVNSSDALLPKKSGN